MKINISDFEDKLENLYNSFDAYYQPYFILISCNGALQLVDEFCDQYIPDKAEESDDIYGADWFDLSSELYLVCISCERSMVDDFLEKIEQAADAASALIHVSVFLHNCIGEPSDTFAWAVQLLEETIEGANGKSSIGINDFKDPDWQGIEQYKI